ncbi:MAG: hypothetical protein IBX39_00075 [Candidatus Methanoperedenaceae archaeon]|nr:hypothetical protein [Candidatus Methanoperedenaceae archaeon]
MIVLDTRVLSAFSETKRLPLLQEILIRLGIKAIIPHTVKKDIIFPDMISAIDKNGGWISVEKVHDFGKYLKTIHHGEAGVITLAKKHGWIAALDDLDARKIARKEQVKITGTLGIIKKAYGKIISTELIRTQN